MEITVAATTVIGTKAMMARSGCWARMVSSAERRLKRKDASRVVKRPAPMARSPRRSSRDWGVELIGGFRMATPVGSTLWGDRHRRRERSSHILVFVSYLRD